MRGSRRPLGRKPGLALLLACAVAWALAGCGDGRSAVETRGEAEGAAASPGDRPGATAPRGEEPGPAGAAPARAAAQGEAGTVIFVLVDSLRRDRLGIYGHARPTSPTLDGLAREGLFLANMVVHASHTVPSTLSLFTSHLPHQHGIQYSPGKRSFVGAEGPRIPRVPERLPLMAELFQQAGYFTAGVVANPWLKADYGFGRGYEDYTVLKTRDGAAINEQSERILRENPNGKLFLYLHYMDVHNSYEGNHRGEPPFERPAAGKYVYDNGRIPGLKAEDIEFTKVLYDERIYYMDGHIAELMEQARRHGRAADLTLVVTSDHGDEFYEHQGLGHGTTLYNELIDSFAVLWNPSRFPARRVDHYVPAIDLLPTLLDGLGLSVPASLQGRAVRGTAPSEARPVFAELADRKAVVHDGWKLHVRVEGGAEELYRVGDDGGSESEPVDDPQVRTRLRGLLEPVLSAEPAAVGETLEIDPETRRMLRELGYLDAEPAVP